MRSSQHGDGFHFTQHALGQGFHCHTGAGGFGHEIRRVHLIERGKIIHIRQKAGGLHHIGKIRAAGAQNGAHIFTALPGLLGDVLSQIPFLAVGVPAITSIYFDWFSGAMQAFIFCMLTTMYIANAAEAD